MNLDFLKDRTFWTAAMTIVFILAATLWPDLNEIYEKLVPLVVTLILAMVGEKAVVQAAAFKYGYRKEKGEWRKNL